MANKSLFPESVEVHSRHLTFESDSRVADENQLRKDGTSRGVMSGLTVTVNAGDNTRIDIATGSGYAPNGEYLTLSVAQTAIQLASNVLGIQNYVMLMQDALQSSPEAHEADGSTRNTKSVNNARVVVLTAASYNALPNSDAVLSNNAKERALVVAIVTGTGGALTGNSIASPSVFRSVLQTNQPTNITGLKIIGIDSTTAVGTGTLTFLTGPKTITWQAPGEGVAGATTTFTTSQVYTITSSGGKTLQVNVTFSQLPVTNQSDSIVVTNIYNQTVPRFTAGDYHHRSYLGTGIPTTTNPHGLTIDDLSPGASGTLEEHQDVMHANGIARISSTSLLAATVNTGVAPDTATITGFAGGDLAYINGKRITALTSSNVITFADGSTEPACYGVYLGQDGNLYKQAIARFPIPASSLLYSKIQILDVVGMTAGSYNLTYNNTLGGSLQLNGGPVVFTFATANDHAYRVYNVDRVGYMDLYVKASSAPGAPEVDAIAVLAQPDPEENIPVCNLVWSGSASGFVGAGFGVGNSPNFVYDKRIYGTLSEEHTRKDAGLINTALLVNEGLGDGIMVRYRTQPGAGGPGEYPASVAIADQFTLGTLAFPSITLNGGVVYINGRRLEINTTTLTVTDNTTNRIYIDADGVVQVSTSSWAVIDSNQRGRFFARMYDLAITAGAETSRTDLRVYTGHKRDAAYGVIGLNRYKQATISTESGDGNPGLTITHNATNGDAILATGSGTGFGAIFVGGNTATATARGNPGAGATNQSGFYGTGKGTGWGILGDGATGGTGTAAGVYGRGNASVVAPSSPAGAGVVGKGVSGVTGGSFWGGGGDSDGVQASATGTGSGILALGGATGAGVFGIGGATSGIGVVGSGGGGNSIGVSGTGSGTAQGVYGTGGSSNGTGVYGFGGTTNGVGVEGQGAGTGSGVKGTGGASSGVGGEFIGGAANGNGVTGTGTGSGFGVRGFGTGNGGGVVGNGAGTGTGVSGIGINGYGVHAESDTTAPARAALRIVPQDTNPTSPLQGDLYVNSGTGFLMIYDGVGWVKVGAQ